MRKAVLIEAPAVKSEAVTAWNISGEMPLVSMVETYFTTASV
jgi:hypothetical protein